MIWSGEYDKAERDVWCRRLQERRGVKEEAKENNNKEEGSVFKTRDEGTSSTSGSHSW